MLNMGLAGMQDPYAGFAPIRQEAEAQYNRGLPSLMERFTSMSPSSHRSSGYKSAMTGSFGDLQRQLAAMQSQYGLQNRGQMMNMANMGLQPTFENQYHPGTQGFLQSMAGPLGQIGLGMATGGLSGMGMFGRGMMGAYNGIGGGYGRGY
jgi:hypothetical protein